MNKKQVVLTAAAPAPIGPYSQAIAANGMLYVSGQIAIIPETGQLIQTDNVAEETRQVMQNLGAVLEAGGSNFAQVVKCGIFLADMNDFAAVNEVYGAYFTSDPPARETVEVSRLPKGVRVEISAIALL
ncbi:MAG: RidA family protein [Chitinophagales bacterium]|nr:RidA family protein [Chitinophagales bacterium]HAE12800.1 reactive intermediate/imine deaminase [Bacteroidota bacterium]MCB9019595.1 RidA family protein [Chitinophagales bacterium]MCB9022797.1 RidA family protein [Chitinophagales bacterium]HAE34186.1 reactive intermediate/imine deaminase [Bacteroidota bacterium]